MREISASMPVRLALKASLEGAMVDSITAMETGHSRSKPSTVIPGWCVSTRPQVRNCAPRNLEIPRWAIAHLRFASRPGTTAARSVRLRHDPDVRFRRFPAMRIDRLGLVVGDRARDDDVFALFPVGRRRNAMLGGHLQGIDHAQNFLEIAAGGHRIDQHQLDLLVRSDD